MPEIRKDYVEKVYKTCAGLSHTEAQSKLLLEILSLLVTINESIVGIGRNHENMRKEAV